jgi:2-methylisocitrate lyase-like PEP mutase family enzyme
MKPQLEPLWRSQRVDAAREAPSKALRTLLGAGDAVTALGIFDGLSARIAAIAKCPVVMTSSALIARALAGADNPQLIGFEQLADAVLRLTGVMNIPLQVRLDVAGLSAATVRHAIGQLERAGAASICLADAGASARLSGLVAAAKQARIDPDLVIGSCHSKDDIECAVASAAAGAETLVLQDCGTLDDARAFAAVTSTVPLQIAWHGGNRPPCADGDRPEQYRILILEHALLEAALAELRVFAQDLSARGSAADLDLAKRLDGLAIEDWYQFTGFDRIGALENDYLPKQLASRYDAGPAHYYRPGGSPP